MLPDTRQRLEEALRELQGLVVSAGGGTGSRLAGSAAGWGCSACAQLPVPRHKLLASAAGAARQDKVTVSQCWGRVG